MKKLVVLALVCSFAVGCSSWRKKTDAAPEGGVVSETTGAGSSEKVDSSPMNYAATGSDSGSIAGLSTVTFEYDKSTLSSGEKAKLQANIQWLKKNASAKMLVEGHCDQRGSTEYNLSLGERRANAVKKMLVDGGIASARLSTVSYGKEKLLATGDSEAEMAKNRRANFVPSSN
ncbi:MAG: OmpA family protein [Bdellovibrionaceae bacterium]|nr:OmpA family protein [Pseudobdellovibrionaceae bacterium]MBC7456994.1 OmpA family protein [Pseudobdellovibrionaceae bacterium]